ncbi:MAG: sugar kinase [Phycisphaerae bacterium]|jgi:sugar/nucleoside kinase (ribokinase family)|nr:sugar kinase [Phycisphaerae bacterium]HOO15921.1 PfkB family carbohydrate kinase [Phycisphaerae bacterium]HPC22667.1 PfkB family carbohydrate kinase [Phycisphaerae bacterium]HRS26914.1 PfkB family carbohydrate kinase [Phycisphaerae bacterium]HRT41783.1 PfkB family carbohydrate kinase [Phycisphaerae bacterium]
MSLLVTGSIALDTLETPAGRAENVLGGSAIYFALAASQFAPVRVVAAVGEDFDRGLLCCFDGKCVDTLGIEFRKGSKSFRWHGRYAGTMNEAQTVAVDLNVLGEGGAPIPPAFRDSRFVFLANTHPRLQREFAAQLPQAQLIVCDTMNLWIENEPAELRRTIAGVHGLVLNEAEARQLSGKSNLVTAGRELLKLGPRFVVIKKGEHGSILISQDDLCIMPAYPTEKVVDPTGCGDSFAGAMMGYLAAQGRWDAPTLRAAIARGTVVASYVIESFSVEAAAKLTRADVDRRLGELSRLARFE